MKGAHLVCTLGTTWAVVPEAAGFAAPGTVDLFVNHPSIETRAGRLGWRGRRLAALWVLTSGSEEVSEPLRYLREWRGLLSAGSFPLRVFRTKAPDSGELAEAEEMRELIYRAVLAAGEEARKSGAGLFLSLAGGRKTMSADMQAAGQLFGCDGLVHILAPSPKGLPPLTPGQLAGPLPRETSALLTPLVVGAGRRNDVLDLQMESFGPVRAERFPLPEASPEGDPVAVHFSPDGRLTHEIEVRARRATELFSAHVRSVIDGERHENFRGLYRLPPSRIDELRGMRVGIHHEDWLRSVPKADLHRHLGGCLGLAAQQEVGRAVWDALTKAEREAGAEDLAPILESKEPFGLDLRRRLGPNRSHVAAALLSRLSTDELEARLYSRQVRRRGLRSIGFGWYELPGELSGSALLENPASWREYARQAYAGARREGLAYCELRCSPQKYLPDEPARFLEEFAAALRAAEADAGNVACAARLIVTVDRRRERNRGSIRDLVATTVGLQERGLVALVGLDLAGDESVDVDLDEMAANLEPAFRTGLPVTIHAGEGEAAERIWEAAYRLHADRVGHGLSLVNAEVLSERFRNRRICVEICPTSNLEVVGFRDPEDPGTEELAEYPLAKLFHRGIPLTVCTDNPGISRTELGRELVVASRLSPGGLSMWDVLAIVKQGFLHAFLPAAEREKLLKDADAKVFDAVREGPLTTAFTSPRQLETG